MINLLYFFLPAILLLGGLASFWDIRHGRVKNWLVLWALAYSAVVYLLLVIYLKISGMPVNEAYISELLTNFLSAVAFSFLLYSFRFWAPGDAKLFIAFSALIPLSFYSSFHISIFPSLVFFSNTFVISGAYLLINSIVMLCKGKKGLGKVLDARDFFKKILILVISIFSFSWITSMFLRSFLPVSGFYLTLISYSCAAVLNIFLARIVKNKKILYLSYFLLSLFNMVFFRAYTSLLNVLSFSLFFSIFKTVAIDMQARINISKARIGSLMPYSQIMQPLFHNKKEICKKGEVINRAKIKEMKSAFSLDRKILVKDNSALAPFMFIGALVTILIKGEVITWLLALIR
ncbi:MAG: prepilin peptidase [archaeon]